MEDIALDIKVGDVLSFAKGGRGVPDELAGKYFRVEAVEGEAGQVRGWKLSKPYIDPKCTQRYHSEAARKWMNQRCPE